MFTYGLCWLLLIALVLMIYIILDGFTLGIGLLFPWINDSHQRHIMMNTVLPVWDGNETWLVFAGAALYAGFPLAFSIILSAYYIPGMILIIGLLFRGISFEFLHKTTKLTKLWESTFALGSFMAVIAQGIIMSSMIYGFDRIGTLYTPRSLFNITTVLTTGGLVAAYSVLAVSRLGVIATKELEDKFVMIGKVMHSIMIIIVVGAVWYLTVENPLNSLFTNLALKISLTLLLIASLFNGYRLSNQRKFGKQFFILVAIYLIVYLYYVLSLLPFIVPFQLTYYQVQSDDAMLKFMLIGSLVFIPLILINTQITYRIFSKKQDKNEISY